MVVLGVRVNKNPVPALTLLLTKAAPAARGPGFPHWVTSRAIVLYVLNIWATFTVKSVLACIKNEEVE